MDGVDGADQAGRVARRQLEVVDPEALLVVGGAVEEHVGHLARLAALEHGFHAVFEILHLVLGADPAGRRIEHHVDFAEQVVERSAHRDPGVAERLLGARDRGEQRERHATLSSSARTAQRGCDVGDTDQFHVVLGGHSGGEAIPDDSVSGDSDLDLAHVRVSFTLRRAGRSATPTADELRSSPTERCGTSLFEGMATLDATEVTKCSLRDLTIV